MNFKWLMFPIVAFGLCQAQYSLTKVASKQFPTKAIPCTDPFWPKILGSGDSWGYVDGKGSEYAIFLGWNRVYVLSIPDLTEVGSVAAQDAAPGCYSYQKLARTYKKHLYVTADGKGTNEGMMIIDLSGLEETPKSIKFVKSYKPSTDKITTHTFDVDTVQGYAYITSQNYDGFRVVDIRDPENPKEVTETKTGSIHDNYIDQGKNMLYVANGSTDYSIYDVTNKAAPVKKKQWGQSNIGYSHNINPTTDGKYALTTSESTNNPVQMWDLDKANNYATPKVLSQWLGGNRLAHNVIVMGELCFVPHYSYGISVLDISNRAAIKEVAHYDNYPDNDNPGYWGVFGAWISPTGNVVIADMDKGDMFLLKFNSPTFVNPRSRGNLLANGFHAQGLVTTLSRGLSGLSITDLSGRSVAGPAASGIYMAQLPSAVRDAGSVAGTAGSAAGN